MNYYYLYIFLLAKLLPNAVREKVMGIWDWLKNAYKTSKDWVSKAAGTASTWITKGAGIGRKIIDGYRSIKAKIDPYVSAIPIVGDYYNKATSVLDGVADLGDKALSYAPKAKKIADLIANTTRDNPQPRETIKQTEAVEHLPVKSLKSKDVGKVSYPSNATSEQLYHLI